MSESFDFGIFFQNRFDDHYLYSINRHTFEDTQADSVHHSHFGAALEKKETLYIILGTDSGLLINYLLGRELPKSSRYVFIEPEELIETIKQRPKPRGLKPNRRITLTTPATWKKIFEEKSYFRYLLRNRVALTRSLGAQDAAFSAYIQLWTQIKAEYEIETWDTRVQGTFFQHKTIQLINAADNHTPAAVLEGRLRGLTAVIAAGGPSLTEALPWIHRHRAHLLLVTVSRVAGILLDHGLTPDVIVSIDPAPVSFDVSYRMLELDGQAVFIHGHHATPGLVQAWTSQRCYIGPLLPWHSSLVPQNFEQWGPTVSNTAAALAVGMGCSRVILCGVDLCFSQEGFTHAAGTKEHAAGPRIAAGDRIVQTNAGDYADSKHEFLHSASSFETLARFAQQHGSQLINPAPQAIAIPGVRFEPWDELEFPELPIAPLALLRRVLPEHDRLSMRKHLITVLREIIEGKLVSYAIQRVAKQILEIVSQLKSLKTRKPKKLQQIDELEDEINRVGHKFAPFIKEFGIRDFIKTVRVEDAKSWTREEGLDYLETYYQAYLKTTEELIDIFNYVENRAISRLDEWQDPMDMETLGKIILSWYAPHFLQHEEYERLQFHHLQTEVVRFQRLFGDRVSQLGAGFQANIRHREQAFHDHVKAIVGDVYSFKIELEQDIDELYNRIMSAFDTQRQDQLERLQKAIEKRAPFDDQEQYLTFIRALLNDLLQEPEQALAEYRQIQLPKLRESSLIRSMILSMNLERMEDALNSIDQLCSLSMYYVPFKANLLKIMGRFEDAINLYTEYLTHNQHDLHTMYKLGEFYAEIGIVDGAEWIMRHLLQIQPDHPMALAALQDLENYKNSVSTP